MPSLPNALQGKATVILQPPVTVNVIWDKKVLSIQTCPNDMNTVDSKEKDKIDS